MYLRLIGKLRYIIIYSVLMYCCVNIRNIVSSLILGDGDEPFLEINVF